MRIAAGTRREGSMPRSAVPLRPEGRCPARSQWFLLTLALGHATRAVNVSGGCVVGRHG